MSLPGSISLLARLKSAPSGSSPVGTPGISATQVAYGSGANQIKGSAQLIFIEGSAMQLSNAVTGGLQLYNTADQVTNYERLSLLWSANVARIESLAAGSGTARALLIGSTNSQISLQPGSSATAAMQFASIASSLAGNVGFKFTITGGGSYTQTSGTNTFVSVSPTYNQASGTAANTDFLINRTETAVGSGAQYWEDRQVGGVSRMATGSAKVLTTDATVTTVQTYTVPASTTWAFDGYVVARRTGGASGTAEDGASYRVEAVFKNAAGTATSIGSSVTVIGESQVGWDVTIDATGATARIRVTGASGNNIAWVWTGNVRQVST